MEALATSFDSTIKLDDVLHGVTEAAVELIDGVDIADVLIIDDGQFRSMAPTGDLVVAVDDLQRRLGQGPCLEAAVADAIIRCPDLRHEQRWPQFAAAAVELGVHSMLSFQLYTRRGGAGALNLLSYEPRTHSMEAEALGAMLSGLKLRGECQLPDLRISSCLICVANNSVSFPWRIPDSDSGYGCAARGVANDAWCRMQEGFGDQPG